MSKGDVFKRIDQLQPGEWFRLRGGAQPLKIIHVSKNIDGIGRNLYTCMNHKAQAKKYKKFPFTRVRTMQED